MKEESGLKKTLLAGVLVLSLALSLWFWVYRNPQDGLDSSSQETGQDSVALVGSDQPMKRKPILSREVAGSGVSGLSEVAKSDDRALIDVPEECRDLWFELATRPVEEAAALLESDPAVTVDPCLTSLRNTASEGGQGAVTAQELPLVRAVVIDKLTGSKKSPDVLDNATIMNKIVARFFKGSAISHDADETLALAEELVRREPDVYAAHKARAVLLVMRQLHQSDPSDQERDAMANALASCREFDVVDPEIEQAEFLPYLVKNDETGLETKLQERLAEDPESPAGNYLMASLYWSRGQGNEAIALLEKASRNAPDDPRYSSTLAKIKKAPSKEKGHFQVSFSFQFLDI
jgi:hypothetical protein